jgi:hypothetical protein
MSQLRRKMFAKWYKPKYTMSKDDWEYIAILALIFTWAPVIGFLTGKILFG